MVLAHNVDIRLRTQDVRITEDIMFNTMLLSENTLEGLKETGFSKPSPIQLHGIPLGKCGFDLLLEAKSGTGKTAVFSVIALEKLNLKKGIQTIILAPTREIAFQIHDVIRQIGVFYKGLKVEVLIGGMPVQEDIEKLSKTVHIVVGSPGRIKHLIQDKYLNVSAVRLLVLDEADKLMEKSFLTDIDYIFSKLPKQKQVIMSSATYPEQSKEFVNKYVKNAQHVCPDTNCILLGIEQKVTTVSSNSNIVTQTKIRFEELKKILSQVQFKQCLIFCNYQVRVGELYKMLTRNKWPAEQLYGQQEQTERLDALKTLQEYKCRILVSTDLAARGIDASNVDLVINFEPPTDWQTYLHRIGRAGRYGSYGTAITILSEGKETQKFKEVLRQTGLPLNLKHTWTDTLFSLENENVESELTETEAEVIKEHAQVNHTYDELWNALSKDSNNQTNDKNDVLSFESLCNSFKSCQVVNEVESFTDLLTSFKNHEVKTNCDDGYRIVKATKLPIYSTIAKQNMKNKQSMKPIKSDENKKQVKDTVTLESSSMSEEPHSDHKDSVDSSAKNSTVKLGVTDSEQALIDAGLPTAFGKVPKYREQRQSNSRYHTNDLSRKKYNHSTYNKRKDEDCDHLRNRRNDSSSTDSESSVESQSYSNIFNFDIEQIQNIDKSNNRESNISNALQQEKINEFNAWYKKLKAQSKRIEQIVYLEEISKF